MDARKVTRVSCVAALLMATPLVCLAGSGAHWKVTVKNPTTHGVYAIAWYMALDLQAEPVETNRIYIAPGGQYTFTMPGSLCPAGVTGEIIWEGHGAKFLQDTNCFGNQTLGGGRPGTTCCSNLTFEICRKQGPSDDSTISDNDYGYCRK